LIESLSDGPVKVGLSLAIFEILYKISYLVQWVSRRGRFQGLTKLMKLLLHITAEKQKSCFMGVFIQLFFLNEGKQKARING